MKVLKTSFPIQVWSCYHTWCWYHWRAWLFPFTKVSHFNQMENSLLTITLHFIWQRFFFFFFFYLTPYIMVINWLFNERNVNIQCVPEKRNREVLMFYHNLITTIINEWYIFGKLRVSSFMWCYSDNAYFTHEWLKAIWRKETKKTFGGRYLNFEEKFTFLESWVSALSYDTSIRKMSEEWQSSVCLK